MHAPARARQPIWVPVDIGRFSGRWVVLAYRASFFCDPVRPTLRFLWASGAEETVTLPAPVCGRAIWRGKLPRGAAVSIDPGPGIPLDRFEIEPLTEMAVTSVAARAARAPRMGIMGLMQHAAGMRDGGRRKLATILHDEPLKSYESWRRMRARPFDPDGIDRRPLELEGAGWLLIKGRVDDVRRWRATIDSLRRQACPHWRLQIDAPDADTAEAMRTNLAMDFDARVTITIQNKQPAADDVVAELVIEAGDCLSPEAVMVLRWAFVRDLSTGAVIFDEDEPFLAGGRMPLFKTPSSAMMGASGQASRGTATRPGATGGIERHIARILLHRANTAGEKASRAKVEIVRKAAGPWVDVVIPTRDRHDMLRRCLDGLLKRTRYERLRLLIADNDTTDPAALRLLAAAARDPRVTILPAPGVFNFAAICNAAVGHASGEVLVFLNNDVEAVQADWLEPLVELAMRPSVGAVGAKLIYPSGSVQHAGIVLGLHGAAGHVYRGAGRHEPGYRGWLAAEHAVSAVTGACLAVERRKFEQAGGFDSRSFAVEFNDVDLCLRLRELGYATVWTPAAELIHTESASRGKTILPGARRAVAERSRFIARWADAIANDPCFHPVFSLASETPRLA